MIDKLLFWLLLCIIYPLAWLPKRVLFVLADITYVLLYHVIQYRKTVVFTNLSRSFPKKSYGEIKEIARQFYRFFADVFFENLYILGCSAKKAQKTISFSNIELLEKYNKEGKSAVIMLGHYGCWEHMVVMTGMYNLKIAYKEQKGAVNSLMKHMRSHFNKDGIIPTQHLLRYMLQHKIEQRIYVFIADQSPAPCTTGWTTFLHQDSLFFNGAEKAAAHLDLPVIYLEIKREGRCQYNYIFTSICEHAKDLPEYEVTHKFAALLEDSIRRNPQYWLWTHKRWKHKKV